MAGNGRESVSMPLRDPSTSALISLFVCLFVCLCAATVTAAGGGGNPNGHINRLNRSLSTYFVAAPHLGREYINPSIAIGHGFQTEHANWSEVL